MTDEISLRNYKKSGCLLMKNQDIVVVKGEMTLLVFVSCSAVQVVKASSTTEFKAAEFTY